MTRHCPTCTCSKATHGVMHVYADLAVGDLQHKHVEAVMEILRGMGFPRYFAQSHMIRVFWEITGNPKDGLSSMGDLYEEIHDIEANLSGYFSYPRFTDPVENNFGPDPSSTQYVWD